MAANLKTVRGSKAGPGAGETSGAGEVQEGSGRAGSLTTTPVEAGAAIEYLPIPVALWSPDRRACVLNGPARELLSFCEHDFGQDASLWLERIHPDDRKSFLRSWKRLQDGQHRISLRYRFLTKSRSEVWLREVSCRQPPSDSGRSEMVWTVYAEETPSEKRFDAAAGQVRGLVRGLTHEIGNNLQAIRGEIDIMRLSGSVPADSAETIYRGINQVRRLVAEINEYLFPSALALQTKDPVFVLNEVMQSREKEMAADGIRAELTLKESLPQVPLDLQFGKALTEVIDFSRALLSRGGELNVEAGVCRQGGEKYLELKIVSSSSSSLQVEEGDVFRPFANVNGRRVGLSMAVAQQILRRHFGKIEFRKEQSNRGVFSLLIRVPSVENAP